ncbi:MAG: CCA tRNA nucleotidyltransferase [Methanosarcinales archaeon]|nr:CCA tRNA nucleotidyltransferase [Methanosarcinales archaeon]
MTEAVLGRVRPTEREREELLALEERLLARIGDLARSRGLDCQGMLVGSAARATWLAGDHDLDIFLSVPEDGDLGAALELARELAPQHEERYAEHAYVHATIEGFDVDLVPCYRVPDATHLRSAVDRTPFHTKYIAARIGGLEDQVLLLKQFMNGAGVYGSELRRGGFSGYLVEILVLRYRSFAGVLSAASSWRPGETIDLEGHSAVEHQDPLVVVDPVDPRRNVAAALTLDRMAQFVTSSRCFLGCPDLSFFFPAETPPLQDQELRDVLARRGAVLILVEFDSPDVVEDVLYPQLRKAEAAVRALLERNGFSVLRSDVHSSGQTKPPKAWMLFEMEVAKLPLIQKRMGPPFWEKDHLSRFLSSHPSVVSGPYLEGGRAVVEVERRYSLAVHLLKDQLSSLSLGKHLSLQVQAGHKIYSGQEILAVLDPGFRQFLSRYFSARMNMC